MIGMEMILNGVSHFPLGFNSRNKNCQMDFPSLSFARVIAGLFIFFFFKFIVVFSCFVYPEQEGR